MSLNPVHQNLPSALVRLRRADFAVVHPAVAGCTENHEVLRCEAMSGRIRRQVKEMVDFAIGCPVLLDEAGFAAQLAIRSAGLLDVSGYRCWPLKELQVSLYTPKHLRDKRLLPIPDTAETCFQPVDPQTRSASGVLTSGDNRE